MTKYIIKFAKSDSVKYVSHLDTVRVFGRSLRRAGVSLSYSQGFNPHPLMTFAGPLGVGVSSICELAEVSIENDISAKELALLLNEYFPTGFKVFAVKKNSEKSPFKNLANAEYDLVLAGKSPNIETFMENESLIMEKRTKSGTNDTDIKPFIKKFEIAKAKPGYINLNVVLNCGEKNLKPELLIKSLERYSDAEISDFLIHRTRLLDENLDDLIKFN